MPATLQASTFRKVSLRLAPFLGLLYFAAFIDRANVSFAAASMDRDLGLSPYVYGLGAGIFFIGYVLFEVPSNLILHRVGGRRWIARIMITWALVAGATAFVKGATSFYIVRFLLGAAEAGFFPGVVYYLTQWAPASRRARLIALFMTAIPISTALGGPISSAVLGLDGLWGLAGWQWLFLTETIPSLVLGVLTLVCLPDRPADAAWLTPEEKAWLAGALASENTAREARHGAGLLKMVSDPRVITLGLAYFGVELGLYGVILWLPQIFGAAGLTGAAAAYASAIPYAIAAVAMVWWCRRSDRAGERVWHIAAASVAGCAGLAASAYLSHSPLLSVIAITLGAAGTLAILPVFWTLPAARLSGPAAAAGIALINAIGNIGGFAGPFVIGWIKQSTGDFTYGLLAVACGVLFTGIVIAMIGADRPSGGDAASVTV